MAPSDMPVVTAANSELDAAPKRTSLPSMLGTDWTWAAICAGVACISAA